MLAVPGGTFRMGKDGSRADESPAHVVSVPAFLAAEAPVTNAEFNTYVHQTSAASPPFIGEARFASPELPVVGISWFEAAAYCEWLSTLSGEQFRLPTEAEREFAAGGGLSGSDWPWRSEDTTFVEWINFLDGPHAPSPECANGYGLRCMAENVHEWCLDWYDPKFYARSGAESPRNLVPSKRRASRGGSWRHREKTTRINARSSLDPTFQYSDFGFRVYADS
jgi:formylglycine-generating enzyme required for sulfatase activity